MSPEKPVPRRRVKTSRNHALFVSYAPYEKFRKVLPVKPVVNPKIRLIPSAKSTRRLAGFISIDYAVYDSKELKFTVGRTEVRVRTERTNRTDP